MKIEVDVRHSFGAFRLRASFSTRGGLTALFGPSGAGKTALLHIVSGLIRPEYGRVVIDGRLLVDTSASVFVPAHRRRIGYVFQEPRLFPHLSVRNNLRFGRWFTPSAERRDNFELIVDLLGISELLGRSTANLSGGEKQRVAIGRALLANPRVLLMDEPLAALDEERKAEILPYLERLRDAELIPMLYVTHSREEVLRLATSAVVISAGEVVAAGAPESVLDATRSVQREDPVADAPPRTWLPQTT